MLTTAFAQKRIELLIELANLQIDPLHNPLLYISKDPQRWVGMPGFCDIGLSGDVLHLGQLTSRSSSCTRGTKPPSLHKCYSFDLTLAVHLAVYVSKQSRTQQTMGPRDALRLCKDAVADWAVLDFPLQSSGFKVWLYIKQQCNKLAFVNGKEVSIYVYTYCIIL